jgi:hypothetical protein
MAAEIVGLQARVPRTVRDDDLKALRAAVDELVPPHLKKPSQDDLVGILIRTARAKAVARAVKSYYDLKYG